MQALQIVFWELMMIYIPSMRRWRKRIEQISFAALNSYLLKEAGSQFPMGLSQVCPISGTRNQVNLPQGGENFHAAEL